MLCTLISISAGEFFADEWTSMAVAGFYDRGGGGLIFV